MYVIMNREAGSNFGGVYIDGNGYLSIFVSTFKELINAKCYATLCKDYEHLYYTAASVWHIPGTEWGA